LVVTAIGCEGQACRNEEAPIILIITIRFLGMPLFPGPWIFSPCFYILLFRLASIFFEISSNLSH
jgi:hypothetical protein